MATAPPPLPPLHARRRASAVRRFPPGCGRHHNAAQPPQHLVPFATNDDPLPPNPSAHEAAKTSPPAARLPGTEGPDRGGGNGPMAGIKAPAAAAVTARRVSAVRRYPPGCGRGAAVPKPEAFGVAGEGEASGIDLPAAVCDGEAEAIAGEKMVVPRESTLDIGESGSDSAGKSRGDGGGGLEACGGRPWIVPGIMSVPFLPWAQHGRRWQQRRKLLIHV